MAGCGDVVDIDVVAGPSPTGADAPWDRFRLPQAPFGLSAWTLSASPISRMTPLRVEEADGSFSWSQGLLVAPQRVGPVSVIYEQQFAWEEPETVAVDCRWGPRHAPAAWSGVVGVVSDLSARFETPYPVEESVSGLPPGLAFDVDTRRVHGSPTRRGVWEVTRRSDDGVHAVVEDHAVFPVFDRRPLACGETVAVETEQDWDTDDPSGLRRWNDPYEVRGFTVDPAGASSVVLTTAGAFVAAVAPGSSYPMVEGDGGVLVVEPETWPGESVDFIASRSTALSVACR